jgi:hypothetical protein
VLWKLQFTHSVYGGALQGRVTYGVWLSAASFLIAILLLKPVVTPANAVELFLGCALVFVTPIVWPLKRYVSFFGGAMGGYQQYGIPLAVLTLVGGWFLLKHVPGFF